MGAIDEKEKGEKIVQIIGVFGSILILLIPALDHRFGWSHVPLYIVVLGDILLIVGYYIVFLAFKVNSFASTSIEIAIDHEVISTGAYSIVRRPMYLGALIYSIKYSLGSLVIVLFGMKVHAFFSTQRTILADIICKSYSFTSG